MVKVEYHRQAAASPPSPLAELLRPYELDLLRLRHRWYAMELFIKELHEANGGRRFEIHDEGAWNWMLDARDMVVIRFGSWAKTLWGKGGLVGKVQADGALLQELRPNFPRGTTQSAAVATHRARAFTRLFPDVDECPRAEHLAALRTTVHERLEPVWRDRSAHRAHPFEDDPRESPFHQNSELEAHLEYAEGVFNDLRLCAGAGVVAYHNHFGDTPLCAARDLVDAILLGGSDRIEIITRPEVVQGCAYRWQRRERVYNALRAAAAERAPDEPFNTDEDIAMLISADASGTPSSYSPKPT